MRLQFRYQSQSQALADRLCLTDLAAGADLHQPPLLAWPVKALALRLGWAGVLSRQLAGSWHSARDSLSPSQQPVAGAAAGGSRCAAAAAAQKPC